MPSPRRGLGQTGQTGQTPRGGGSPRPPTNNNNKSGKPLELGTLAPRDFFGEDALLGAGAGAPGNNASDHNHHGGRNHHHNARQDASNQSETRVATASVISMTSVEVLLLRKGDLFQKTSYGTRELMRHNLKSDTHSAHSEEQSANTLLMNSELGVSIARRWEKRRADIVRQSEHCGMSSSAVNVSQYTRCPLCCTGSPPCAQHTRSVCMYILLWTPTYLFKKGHSHTNHLYTLEPARLPPFERIDLLHSRINLTGGLHNILHWLTSHALSKTISVFDN